MKKTILVLSSAIISYSLTYCAHADILFSCKTINGKNIKIERYHEDILYSLSGETGKYEIQIKNEISASNIVLGNNSDGHIYDTIIFHNGDFRYMVVGLNDINTPSEKTRSGVIVYKNVMKLAEINCFQNTVINKLDSLAK